jgi:hypothetical protein
MIIYGKGDEEYCVDIVKKDIDELEQYCIRNAIPFSLTKDKQVLIDVGSLSKRSYDLLMLKINPD